MRNGRVKVTGQPFDILFIMFALDLVQQFFEYGEALLDMVLGELSQGHLLGVVADLHHLLLHHVQIEDQLHQSLHRLLQFTLRKYFALVLLGLGGRLVIVVITILLVVHLEIQLDLLVIALISLLVVLALVLSYRTWDGHGAETAHLALGADSSPPGEEVAMVGIAIRLDDLEDVEFVIVIGH